MQTQLVTRMVAFLLSALIAMPAGAQVNTRANNEAVWRDFVGQLGPNAFVRVKLAGGHSLTGHVIAADDASVRISPRTRVPVPLHAIAYSEIVSMERRQEPRWNPATKVLLGVGIAVGVLYALAAVAIAASD